MEYLGEKSFDPNEIVIVEPFSNALPDIVHVRERIFSDIATNGFLSAFPVIGWLKNGKVICVDGKTRTQGSIEAGIPEIPVKLYKFTDEEEALMMSYKSIGESREKNDYVIYYAVKQLDSRSRQGVATGEGSTRDRLAEIIGTSAAKIGRCFTVMNFCKEFDEEEEQFISIIQKTTLNAAISETRKIRKLKEDLNCSPDHFDKKGENTKKGKCSTDHFQLPDGTFKIQLSFAGGEHDAYDYNFIFDEEKRTEIEEYLSSYLSSRTEYESE